MAGGRGGAVTSVQVAAGGLWRSAAHPWLSCEIQFQAAAPHSHSSSHSIDTIPALTPPHTCTSPQTSAPTHSIAYLSAAIHTHTRITAHAHSSAHMYTIAHVRSLIAHTFAPPSCSADFTKVDANTPASTSACKVVRRRYYPLLATHYSLLTTHYSLLRT